MVDRDLRSANDDAVQFVDGERAARLDGPDTVERGVVAADAGIELERQSLCQRRR